jgi:hypothetical protein
MAVTIQKKGKVAKKKAKAKATTKPSIATKLVNKLGDMYREMAPHEAALKPLKKSWKPLYSEVQAIVDEKNKASEEASLKTEKYVAAFTAHGNSTSISDAHKCFELLESVKKGLAWELMGFGITELRKYLTPDQFELVTATTRSTARSVTITYLDDED